MERTPHHAARASVGVYFQRTNHVAYTTREFKAAYKKESRDLVDVLPCRLPSSPIATRMVRDDLPETRRGNWTPRTHPILRWCVQHLDALRLEHHKLHIFISKKFTGPSYIITLYLSIDHICCIQSLKFVHIQNLNELLKSKLIGYLYPESATSIKGTLI